MAASVVRKTDIDIRLISFDLFMLFDRLLIDIVCRPPKIRYTIYKLAGDQLVGKKKVNVIVGTRCIYLFNSNSQIVFEARKMTLDLVILVRRAPFRLLAIKESSLTTSSSVSSIS